MLKSTYKPPATALQSLPPGWTEHKAPSGHTYYYNASTETSTYTRPGRGATVTPPAPAAMTASVSFMQHQAVPNINLSDPRVANAFMAQYGAPPLQDQFQSRRGGFHGGRGGRGGAHNDRPRPQPVDKPRSKVAIPGCEPWILVFTKYGRRFAYNPAKNASYWRIPEKLKLGILELDQARIRAKADAATDHENEASGAVEKGAAGERDSAERDAGQDHQVEDEQHDNDSSEYEEVEVTDDEEYAAQEGDEHPSKRQRTEESSPEDDQPAEFSEADIAFQLQAMGEEYGLEPGEYDDGRMEEWPEGAEGLELSEEDARGLFKDLLDDFHINPYSPWEKLIEEGKIIDDPRYTVLHTTTARKEVWDEWSREKIKQLKEQRARQEKTNPRIPYMAFLQEKATPKLYWPEFRRKYKKEPPMKDVSLADKDKEKLYREHINRLKLPLSKLKTDLTALMKSVPSSQLNNKTLLSHLPPQIVTDVRYISLDPKMRDPLVEAYIQTLPPPPEDGSVAQDHEAAKKASEVKQRREKALQDREKAVEAEKRRHQKKLQYSKSILRDEERELEAAMNVGKKGLQRQLARPVEDGKDSKV